MKLKVGWFFKPWRAKKKKKRFLCSLDIRLAVSLIPNDTTIQTAILKTEPLLALTEIGSAAYIVSQPKSPRTISYNQHLG